MEKDKIEKFEKLHIQIKDMYNELSILSKKSPDGAINKFNSLSKKSSNGWVFLRLYDKMVLGDERCWNAEKWIAES